MAKAKKLPEAGQWPDKLVQPALIVSGVLLVVGVLLAFFYAGPVNGAAVEGVESPVVWKPVISRLVKEG